MNEVWAVKTYVPYPSSKRSKFPSEFFQYICSFRATLISFFDMMDHQ